MEQNFIIPNVPSDRVDAILKERLFQEYTPFPGKLVSNMVACTGNQFCGFAQIEPSARKLRDGGTLGERVGTVERRAYDLDRVPELVRTCKSPTSVSWARRLRIQPGKRAWCRVNIFIGTTVGERHLKEKPEISKVPCSELKPVLEEIMIERFGATRKATPTPNPDRASRWKINKSGAVHQGVPRRWVSDAHMHGVRIHLPRDQAVRRITGGLRVRRAARPSRNLKR